ncbi:MAG: response regulator [Candidatus Uhrbacteria bacterium]
MPTKAHILITEDNVDIQAIYQAKLLSEGYDVASASDGKEAFVRIREQMPDLILLDIIMPGMDGLEFLRKAAKEKSLAGVPIVVMTNLGQDEDRVQCEKLGATKFLIKTEISIDDLANMVKEVLAENP